MKERLGGRKGEIGESERRAGGWISLYPIFFFLSFYRPSTISLLIFIDLNIFLHCLSFIFILFSLSFSIPLFPRLSCYWNLYILLWFLKSLSLSLSPVFPYLLPLVSHLWFFRFPAPLFLSFKISPPYLVCTYGMYVCMYVCMYVFVCV